MGADLITFICKGPTKLPKKKRDEAVVLARATIYLVKEAFRLLDDEEDLSEKQERQVLQLTGLPDMDDVRRYFENIENAEKVVDDLYEAWNCGFRDVNGREDPDDSTQSIVVAGELSWGDEPDGAGYQAFRHAQACGLFEFFGIR